MLAHFARLCTVFVRCLACLVGGFLLADLAFVVPRLAPVLCRMFSVFLVCHGFLACVSDAGLACAVCMLSALAGYGFACVMTTMSHGFALAALVCPLAKMLAGMALAMAGDTGMRFAGLLGTCLAADRCGIAWQWQIIGQREAGQQCQHAGKQNAKHEYNPFLKTHGDIALHHRHVSQIGEKRAEFAALRRKISRIPIEATFCSWVLWKK
ncbi:hypothetical protein [Rivihabitans pingtungensis]|uniref:hypothetical protein n=1 Tax=Rivihabitans pingtungensis TaxID=1054498 RepID=UPI002FD9821B